MLRRSSLGVVVCLCLLAGMPAFAQNSDVRVISRTVTLPVDASEVTLTLKAFSDMLVHDVLFDNSPTGTNGLCTPDFTAIPPFCSSGTATFEISAFRIGGVFFKTGNTPYDFSSSHRLAVFSLRGVHLDDELPLVIPKNTTFQVTLRVSDASVPPENDVAVKATFGVTGGTGVSLTTETGPVNP